MLNIFFHHLSNRLYKENALSDVTWAMCISSDFFRINFLRFFFDDDDFSQAEIHREYSKGGSRPDFWIKTIKNEYLIEVKIYDQNHHFEQYQIDFPNTIKGYIANYEIGYNEGYSIKTWGGLEVWFKNLLSTSENISIEEHNLIKGYFSYLISVCSIIKYQKMNFTNLKSLYHFNYVSNDIINTPIPNSDLKCQINAQAKGITEFRSGKYITIFKGNTHLVIGDPWFGIYYETGAVYIQIVPYNHEKSPFLFLDKALSDGKLIKGTYHGQPYKEDGDIWFEINQDQLNIFNADTTTIEAQKDILLNFFQEVILCIEKEMKN